MVSTQMGVTTPAVWISSEEDIGSQTRWRLERPYWPMSPRPLIVFVGGYPGTTQPPYVVLPRGIALPAWFPKAIARIQHLLTLEDNWDSYGASRVNHNATRTTVEVLSLAAHLNVTSPEIVPTPAGGLQLEWHKGEIDLEIEVTPGGRLIAVYEKFDPPMQSEEDLTFNLERLQALLRELPK